MQSGTQIRVLIIDDDLEFREGLRILLSAEGYSAQIMEDAVEGGKALLSNLPDLIVCDINMPFLNGFELLSLLRSDENTKALPVIIVSGDSDIDTLSKAVHLGASDYLIKPVTRERLLDSIRTCLAKAST